MQITSPYTPYLFKRRNIGEGEILDLRSFITFGYLSSLHGGRVDEIPYLIIEFPLFRKIKEIDLYTNEWRTGHGYWGIRFLFEKIIPTVKTRVYAKGK